jgi:transposase-like protein
MMPELLPATTQKRCPRPECASTEVFEVDVDNALEELWCCRRCEKPFLVMDGYA